MTTTILIPAYEPNHKLLTLIDRLKDAGFRSIVVVDDGSGERYADLFRSAGKAGCAVLTHVANRGKGRALKTGFQHLMREGIATCVVCADSDGQHLPEDIRRIAETAADRPGQIVLGTRRFTGNVPLRSRFGNSVTRGVYAFATGTPIHDTQTGLRGYSSDMLEWLCRVSGERFEYEMNLLLEAPSAGYSFHEVPIDTVYLNKNESSHFRPLADSARIYYPIVKFGASSAGAALVDFFLLLVIQIATMNLLFAVIGARVCSSILNYAVNRKFVFSRGRPRSAVSRSMPRYFALVALILALNYGLMFAFHERLGIALVAAKLLTEGSLFLFSYWAQRKLVY
ncbi:glycosyltransferase [Cohnella suwonensis]|uniref:Glycosyltransferase n=1 Tax=Cohnella suwonensis TaxID=696072 RepID=A0ABW0LU05_9BACL